MVTKKEKEKFIAYLQQFVTKNKQEKIAEVLPGRTRFVTLLLEDVYQAMNTSAILRSCDCFGIQDIHVVESRNTFEDIQGISRGAAQWLTLYRYDAIKKALTHLKKSGYQIIVTSPHAPMAIEDLPLDKKIALAFGTEITGASDVLIQEADFYVNLPMYGFTESFNVSVSVALCLSGVIQRLHASQKNWYLSSFEEKDLVLQWFKNIVGNSEKHERYFKSHILKKK